MAGSVLNDIPTPEVSEFAPLIVLLPMVAFAVILFLGRVFNGNPTWKNTVKEGGIIALGVMGAVLVLSLLLIADFIGSVQAGHDSVFHWFTSGVWDGTSAGVSTDKFGFGIYVDHITVMLLFVAAFLCLLINIFSIGYMNTDPINDNRNHRFYAEFTLFCSGMLGMVLG